MKRIATGPGMQMTPRPPIRMSPCWLGPSMDRSKPAVSFKSCSTYEASERPG